MSEFARPMLLGSQFFPDHDANKMANEGDVVGARQRFLAKRPNNLRYLLEKRFGWMNAYIKPGMNAIELGSGAGFLGLFVEAPIALSDVDNPPRVILTTSSVPGEGKSTFGASLAMSAATAGQRVLLIDGDLRHPSTSKLFNLQTAKGLVDLLAGTAQPSECLVGFNNGRMVVLPAGSGTKNSPDLLSSQKMQQLIESSRAAYDIVFIDSPPVTAVVDGLVLAGYVDKIVFVIEWETTPREVVARAMNVLGDSREKLAGAVLNKADVRQLKYHSTYYSYYNTYYNKRYSKYYEE